MSPSDAKWPWALQGQRYPVHVPLVRLESQISLRCSPPLHVAISDIFAIFNFLLGNKVKLSFFLNLKKKSKSMDITLVWTVTGDTYNEFGRKRTISVKEAAFWNRVSPNLQVHQLTLNAERSKVPPYMFYWHYWVPNFTAFRSIISQFQDIYKFSF